jgi:TolB-like protein/Flp pilus assembly protein TadD
VASKLSSFLAELKRRKVYSVGVGYLVVGAVLAGAANDVLPRVGASEQVVSWVIVLLLLGFPVALILAWFFEVKSEGRTPEEPQETKADGSSETELASDRTTTDQRKSIVVLPFDNMSPDPGDSYFCEGLTEEIITHLSHIRSLRVISRTSAMALKGTKKNTGTIAEELGVQFVLEGSVRKAGEDLRITAQLIDAPVDEHLWAETFDGVLEDVFDIQESVSRSIVESLRLTISPDESQRLADRPIEDLQTYECYLKSREEFWRWDEEGLERALTIIQNGLEILGERELLYVALGTVHAQYIHFGLGKRKDESHLQKAEECVEKVFSFNPESPEGHYLKGFTQWWRGEQADAARHLKKALSLDPNHSDALVWLGWIYAISGKGSLARPLLSRARQVDPLNFSVYGHTSGSELMEGDFPAALETLRRCEQLHPESPFIWVNLAFWLVYSGRIAEAREYIEHLQTNTPESAWAHLGLFLRHALDGDREKALESVSDRLRAATEWNEIYPLWMAGCYALIDEREEAIDWIEEAVRWGCKAYRYLNEYDPLLENVRGEPRFKKLMEDVKHRSETFEV